MTGWQYFTLPGGATVGICLRRGYTEAAPPYLVATNYITSEPDTLEEDQMIKVTLLDGSTTTITSRPQLEQLWLSDRISLVEAASCLTKLLHLHPSHATIIWHYLESLTRTSKGRL